MYLKLKANASHLWYYIGLSDRRNEGIFEWEDGMPFDETLK